MRHLTRISRFSLSVAWLQPKISAIEREQPRQTLFSSRQQLRTHGDSTPSEPSAIETRPLEVLEVATILRMLTQAPDNKVHYIPRHARGQVDKTVHDFCGIKCAIRVEQRGFLSDTAALAVVDNVVSEPAARFPPEGMLVAVFVVSQLKGCRHSIRPEPYANILLVGKEPSPRKLAFS